MNRPLLPCLGWLGVIALALPAEANDGQKSKCCEKQKCEERAKQCTVSTTTSCTTTAPVAVSAPAPLSVATAPTPACGATACSPGQASAKASCSTPGFTYSAPGVSYCAPGSAWTVKCGKDGTTVVQAPSNAAGVYAVAGKTPTYAVAVPQPVASVPDVKWGGGPSQRVPREAQAESESHGLKSFLRRILSDDQNDVDADDAPDADASDMDEGESEEWIGTGEEASEPEEPCDAAAAMEPGAPCEAEAPCVVQHPKLRGLYGAALMDDDQDDVDADDDADDDADVDDDQDADAEFEAPEFAEFGDVWTPETLEALQGLEGLEGLAVLNGEDGQLHAINLEKLRAEHRRMSSEDVRRIQDGARKQAAMAEKYMKEARKAAKHAGKGADYQAALEQAQEALNAASAAAHDGQLQALESLRALESLGAAGGRRSKCTPPRVIIQGHAAEHEHEHDGDLERRVSELEARLRNRGELRSNGDSEDEMGLEQRVERLERALRNDPDDIGQRPRQPKTRMHLKGPIGGSVIAPQSLPRVPRAPLAIESAPDEPAVVLHVPRDASPDQAPSKDSSPMKWRIPSTPLLWKVPTYTAPRTPAPPVPAIAPIPRHAPSAPSARSQGDDDARRSARAKLERLMKDMHAEVQSLRDEMLRLRRELEEMPETMSEDHAR